MELFDEKEVLHWELEYENKFGVEPPIPPMMVSKYALWYIDLLANAIETEKMLYPEDIDNFVKKHNIQYDIVEEEGEQPDGDNN